MYYTEINIILFHSFKHHYLSCFEWVMKNNNKWDSEVDLMLKSLGSSQLDMYTGGLTVYDIKKEIYSFLKFEICLSGDHKFDDFTDKIIDYIYWLGNCKKELVEFYNTELSEDMDEVADDDWFDTLELYRVRIIVGQNGYLYSEISGGDDFWQDHILDIETSGKTISSMSYDG